MATNREPDLLTILDSKLLQEALTEPRVSLALAEARALDELLATSNLSEEDVAHLIADLDRVWAPFHKQVMQVTGDVTVYNNCSSRQKGYVIDKSKDGGQSYHRSECGEEMLSHGFVAEYDESGRYRVKLITECTRALVTNDGPANVKQTIGVDIYNVQIDFTEQQSFERAHKWLETFAPDIIEEIDSKILNGNVRSVADAILALRDIDLSAMLNYHGDDSLELGRCIKTYLEILLDPDLAVPYVIGFDGLMIESSGGGRAMACGG